MTVPASQPNRYSYAGNGVTTDFAYSSKFLADADLVVVSVNDTTGVETVKTLTTDYTVAGAGTSAGTVTMLTAPASGTTLVIYGDPAISQLMDPVNGGELDVDVEIEAPLDKLTIIARRLKDIVTRSLRQPEGDTADIGRLPALADRLGKFLYFNATTGDPEAAAGTTEVPVSAFMETVLDDATAAAARTTLGVGDIVPVTSAAGTNTVTGAIPAANAAYATNGLYVIIPAATNTGAATLNLTPSGASALGAKNVYLRGAACVGGELVIGVPRLLVYDGTQFNIAGDTRIASATVAAHATTANIWAAQYVTLSGSVVTFTDFPDAPYAGATAIVVANAAHILTDGANIEVQGDANHTCAAGDVLLVTAKTTTTFQVSIFRGTGVPVAGQSAIMKFVTIATGQLQNTTLYLGGGYSSATEDAITFPAPFKCIVKNLHVRSSAVPGGSDSVVFTFRSGGFDTALTCTETAAQQTATDVTNSVSVAKGALITIKSVSSATAATAVHRATIELVQVP